MCEIKMLQEWLTFCAWRVMRDPINLQMQSWVLAVNWSLDKRYNTYLFFCIAAESSGKFFWQKIFCCGRNSFDLEAEGYVEGRRCINEEKGQPTTHPWEHRPQNKFMKVTANTTTKPPNCLFWFGGQLHNFKNIKLAENCN